MRLQMIDYFPGFASDGERHGAVAQCYDNVLRRDACHVFDYEMVRCRLWPQTWLPRRISEVKRLLRRRVLMRHRRDLQLTLGKILDPVLRWTIVEFLTRTL